MPEQGWSQRHLAQQTYLSITQDPSFLHQQSIEQLQSRLVAAQWTLSLQQNSSRIKRYEWMIACLQRAIEQRQRNRQSIAKQKSLNNQLIRMATNLKEMTQKISHNQWVFILLYTIIMWQIAAITIQNYTLPYWQYWSTLGVSSLTAAFLGRFVFMRYNRNANRERYREAVEYIKEAEGRIGDLERREKGKRYKEEEKGSYVPQFDFMKQ